MSDINDEIEWEDPPPSKSNADRQGLRIKAMIDNPKRWLVWRRSTSPGMLTGLKQRHERKGFEFTSRAVGNGKYDIYGRYNPPEEL